MSLEDQPLEKQPIQMSNSESKKDSIQVKTFGCRLNIYETEVMRQHAKDSGQENLIIINTCAVTQEAEKQSRRAVRKLKKENPKARIVVTGCAAQLNPDSFAQMEEVSQVLGNEEKLKASSWSQSDHPRVQVNDIMQVKETASHLLSGFIEKTRAFLQVQQGCDHRCTFCIIPYARGNSRSVPIGEVVSQVKTLVQNGVKEIVLTGVDVSSYGADLPGQPSLGQMMRRLLALVPDLPRLRLSSIDSIEIDDELLELLSYEKRLMPHLHLSLQAGDDLILKRMKRRHLAQDAINLCQEIKKRRPDVVFGADIIAGFPTETEEMFQNTLKIVDACDLTYLHVFPYSERPGTPAARMPQVALAERKERAARLRAVGEDRLNRFLTHQVGTHVRLLMEKNNQGRSEQFALVSLKATKTQENWEQGQIVDAKIIGVEGQTLIAEAVV